MLHKPVKTEAWARHWAKVALKGCLILLCWAEVSAEGWKAGFSRTVITPQKPIWMSGYASRDHAAEATRTELWAKATALEDARGR